MFAAATFTPPTLLLDISLMAILVIVAVSIVRMRSLFGIVMLQGVYSLVSAAWFVSLDAVDVAFTEAAVGAGVSTVLMLAAMLLADRKSAPVPLSKQWGPLLIVVFVGLAMFYAIGDMPAYGDANSPANSYVGMDYMERTAEEIHIPNVVTAVLASYRGYDTFGEAVVIFSAGLGVLLLLGLNGNAGRWRAECQGTRVSTPSAPSASTSRTSPAEAPKGEAATAKSPPKKTTAKKAPPKKASPKKASGAKKTPKTSGKGK
ncbi:DUF4040 domain-containing protein [Litorimonas sp.]|uniref:DUF4040 domain-containing protein n=1 Tax=Litorimonas sp. TaxID=1892381 RepID=UPI003A899572